MSTQRLDRLDGSSLGHRTAKVLREAILSGVLTPGERLLETGLAEQFGTSNGPVRDALALLENEGLVVREPYRGAFVAGISADEIDAVLVPVRVTIERFAFAVALPLLTEDDFVALADLIEDMRAAELAGDADRVSRSDLRFHELVIRRSGHHHCLQLWRVIQPRVGAYFRRDANLRSGLGPVALTVADQHEALLVALRTGNREAVQSAIETHVHIHL